MLSLTTFSRADVDIVYFDPRQVKLGMFFLASFPLFGKRFESFARYIIRPEVATNTNKRGDQMRFLGIVVAAASLVFIAGCGTTVQPIYNVQSAPITAPAGKTLSMTEVQQAILRAGTQLGWQMQPERPGRISGRLALRTHLAVVDIEHDTKSYSIKYRDSTNLEARDGMIHRNYNGWIQNLEKAIRVQTSI
jgi:hypothetical protein